MPAASTASGAKRPSSQSAGSTFSRSRGASAKRNSGREPQVWRKTISGYAPYSDAAKAAWQKGPLGELVTMDVRRPRNLAHNALYWVILGMVVENSEIFDRAEDLHLAIKAALGHGKWIDVGGSRQLFIPNSTDFGSMDQVEFDKFFNDALTAIDRYWLPVGVETLLREGKAREGAQ